MCALGWEEALGVKDLPCCSIGSTQLPDLASMGEGWPESVWGGQPGMGAGRGQTVAPVPCWAGLGGWG